MTQRVVDVAAAVVEHDDGRFLLAQRPLGKVYEGYWEFPGGKVEPGEPITDALNRELREELGIAVELAYPWITRVYVYPHATVRLHFYRVVRWRGEPHPHERQALSWQYQHELNVSPILPANAPVLKALSLPTSLGRRLPRAQHRRTPRLQPSHAGCRPLAATAPAHSRAGAA